eukprot:CAMPEP_0174717858 /NCGR_PEP_ID=MMETSP1094-20130205/27378_1 /TAXON_ID=156173 /ORGANISM="Chrysochromulina brevifilum, Strain UTEX LB 985" /LENGTH=200 /DNA_ID=CAMNT_0015917859 /DNA_START=421 /DNA_END=1021 /DNA_ORIENTATION=-
MSKFLYATSAALRVHSPYTCCLSLSHFLSFLFEVLDERIDQACAYALAHPHPADHEARVKHRSRQLEQYAGVQRAFCTVSRVICSCDVCGIIGVNCYVAIGCCPIRRCWVGLRAADPVARTSSGSEAATVLGTASSPADIGVISVGTAFDGERAEALGISDAVVSDDRHSEEVGSEIPASMSDRDSNPGRAAVSATAGGA